jgi:hypothetical protein
MMEKRYQVFVSSTYTDLLVERAEVMQALLELDCMPAGMELFPAASEEQWRWIKKVIDESDYYIVIVAGRYGTISEQTGMSYTEMEYRYAIESNKPVIGFLHEEPARIEVRKTESSPQARKKRDQFRKLVEQRLCKYWTSPADLGAKVSRSLTQLIKHQPAIGWVRADSIPRDQTHQLQELQKEVNRLQHRLRESTPRDSADISNLQRGSDPLVVSFVYHVMEARTDRLGRRYWVRGQDHDGNVNTSWDKIFEYLSPGLTKGEKDSQISWRLERFIHETSLEDLQERHPGGRVEQFRIYSHSFDMIRIQFRALGLISLREGDTWTLTGQGDRYMIQLLAAKRNTERQTTDDPAADTPH